MNSSIAHIDNRNIYKNCFTQKSHLYIDKMSFKVFFAVPSNN